MRTPHPTQILTLLFILEFHLNEKILYVFEKTKKLQNKLIQLLTGEGKSIILGLLSAFFAIIGYNVDVVCYSPYLS